MKKIFNLLLVAAVTLFVSGCGSDDVAGASKRINPPKWIIGQWQEYEAEEEEGNIFWMTIEFTKGNLIYDSNGFNINLKSAKKGKMGVVEQINNDDRFKFRLIEYSGGGANDAMTMDFRKVSNDEIEMNMDFIGPFRLKRVKR